MMAQEVKKIKLNPSKVNGRLGYRTVKRGFDILASGLALILLSPLFLVLIILKKKKMVDQPFIHKSELEKMRSLSKCGNFVL